MPFAYNTSINSIIIPITCRGINTFMGNFLPVNISPIAISACPPSSAGIGKRFITAKIIDKMLQKFIFTQEENLIFIYMMQRQTHGLRR